MTDILGKEWLPPMPPEFNKKEDIYVPRWWGRIVGAVLRDTSHRDAPYRLAFLMIILEGRNFHTDEYAPKGWTAIGWEKLKKHLRCGDKRLSRIIKFLEEACILKVFRRGVIGRKYTTLYRVPTHQEYQEMIAEKKRKAKFDKKEE